MNVNGGVNISGQESNDAPVQALGEGVVLRQLNFVVGSDEIVIAVRNSKDTIRSAIMEPPGGTAHGTRAYLYRHF